MVSEAAKDNGHMAIHQNGRLPYVALIVCLVLPIVIGGLFINQMNKQALDESVMARRENLVATSAAVAKAQFDGLVNLGVSLANRPLVRNYAAEGKWYEAINTCQDALENSPVIERLFMTDAKGVMVSDLPVATPSVIGQSRVDKDWFKGVSRKWQPYVSEIYLRGAEPKINVIAVAAPVRNEKQEVVGVLVLQIKLSEIISWLEDTQPDEPAFIYLVDQRGNVLGHPRYPDQGKITNFSSFSIVQKVLRGEHGLEEAYNPIDKEQRLSAYEPVAGYGWGVILAEPTFAVYAAANKQFNLNLVVYGLLLLTGGFAAVFALLLLVQVNRLRRKEEVVMGSIADAVAVIDRHRNIVYWNKAAAGLTGWSAGETLGRPMQQVLKFVRDAAGSENVTSIEEAILKGESRRMSDRMFLSTKDGKIIAVGVSVGLIPGLTSTVDGAVVIFRNV
jgi:PAS domain S-box-containing protein